MAQYDKTTYTYIPAEWWDEIFPALTEEESGALIAFAQATFCDGPLPDLPGNAKRFAYKVTHEIAAGKANCKKLRGITPKGAD